MKFPPESKNLIVDRALKHRRRRPQSAKPRPRKSTANTSLIGRWRERFDSPAPISVSVRVCVAGSPCTRFRRLEAAAMSTPGVF